MGEYTVYTSTQIPHILRTTLTVTTGIAEARIRVIAPDVGGGGSKLEVYPEDAICLVLAKQLGRPVKWVEAGRRTTSPRCTGARCSSRSSSRPRRTGC